MCKKNSELLIYIDLESFVSCHKFVTDELNPSACVVNTITIGILCRDLVGAVYIAWCNAITAN